MATQTGSIDLKAMKASSDIAVAALEQSVEYIVGTQTATTASWTGVTADSVLKAGKTIAYKLTQTSAANATLNLTLAGGGTTGAKAVYYNTSRVGTHYPKDSVIIMTYNGTDWRITNYNSDTINRTRLQNVIKAAAAITSGRIICGTASGYRDIGANVAFDLSYPLLYAGSTLAANATGDNNYLQINGINASSSGTITSGTEYKQLYLKGTVSGKTFTIAASPFLTTVEPTSDDGFCYIPLGMFYNSTTNIYFNSTNKLFGYRDGMFGELSLREASAAAKTATNFLSTDSSGIMIYDGKNGAQTPSNPSADTKNVFIDSDSVDVRKGTTVLATFGADGVRIGNDTGASIEQTESSINFLVNGTRKARITVDSGGAVAFSYVVDEQQPFGVRDIVYRGNGANGATTFCYEDYANGQGETYVYGNIIYLFTKSKIQIGRNAPIVQDKFSAINLSASTYYVQHNFAVAKSGYTPIAFNPYTNHAIEAACMVNYNSTTGIATVTVMSRNNSISGLNLYLDVTYARNELL